MKTNQNKTTMSPIIAASVSRLLKITINYIKQNRLTSGELLLNDRRAVGFVSSYPHEGGGGGEGAAVHRGAGGGNSGVWGGDNSGVGSSSTSKNRLSHHKYKSPKQFL